MKILEIASIFNLFDTIIPIGVKVTEAMVIGKSVFEHAKDSNVAKVYEKLTQEIVRSEKVERKGTQER